MGRRGTAVKLEPPEDPERLPKGFNYRPSDPALNVRIREYLLDNGVSFNDICEPAVLDFLSRHPRFPRKHLRLPRGKRPRLP